ncbi:MAG: hypothetical protein K2L38_11075 [Dysosmobacter sp.]|nr:hypothetical protein [Dysosmobacter sp.]
MEYNSYLEQKFHDVGRWETRTLTAQEAKVLGHEDGYKAHGEGYTLYVDGYDSLKAIQDFLDDVAATEAAYSEADDQENDRGGER